MKRGIVTNATNWRSRKLQGRCIFQGLPVSIENERGSYRQGLDPNTGEPWRTFMHYTYGYIRGTEGTDGDHVDVYIGPSKTSTRVFIVHQQVPETKVYDEDKVMLGFNTPEEAKSAYLRQYDKAGFFQSMTMTDIADFKTMLKEKRGVKLKKSNEFIKAKYLRRWRGKDGKWYYQYHKDKVTRSKKFVSKTGTLPGMSESEVKAVLKNYRRRAPGKGKEKTIQRPAHLGALLAHSTFCMMSAGRNPEDSEDMKLTDSQIRDRYDRLLDDMREKGYIFTRCRGKYVNPEESIMCMCHDADREEMMVLGKKYKQDSIVFSDKGRGSLIYTTGKKAGQEAMAGEGYEVVPNADDFYTLMPLGDGSNIKFTVNLEELVKAMLVLFKGGTTKYLRKFFKNGKWYYEYSKPTGGRLKSLGKYTILENLGGTTGGAFHIRLSNGEEKVIKGSTSEGHIRDEYLANKIYKILGVPIPNVFLAKDRKGELVQVADHIKGVPINSLSSEDWKAAIKQIQKGFVADALLGNWDVLGLDNDNILWDGSKAWRIDNGGSLRYRAQGALKGGLFGAKVSETESMRDPSRSASFVFGTVTNDEIRKQVGFLIAKKDTILTEIPDPGLRKTIESRIQHLSSKYGAIKSLLEGDIVKGTSGQWYIFDAGKPVKFYWLRELSKSGSGEKRYYSADEVKARGMRWVTIRGARVLLQGTSDGEYVVVGGAGGKLNHLKVDKLLSKDEYKKKQKQIRSKKKEETQKLTKEDISEAARKQRERVVARRTARSEYMKKITNILGTTAEEIRGNITASDMEMLEDKARSMVEARRSAKTMSAAALEGAVEAQTEKEIDKAVQRHVKNAERDALDTLMRDYMPQDPNSKDALKNLLDKDKALEILTARKQFKKEIKAIGKATADIPTDLRLGDVFAAVTASELEDIQDEVREQAETAKNIQLYDLLNAQSKSINTHIDQGAISALNGLLGDVYGSGATFTVDTVKELGIEAVSRIVTSKIQMDGKGAAVKKALEEYVATERQPVVDRALKETQRRLENADQLRNMARDTDDAEAILSMASANGHALKQITAAQRSLGTAVGSLRAAAHTLNALEDPVADVIQIDMGKDLSLARNRARNAGLLKGTYTIQAVKRGSSTRLVMEIPRESLNSFFQGAVDKSVERDRLAEIKAHKANRGYKPPGIKESIKFDAAQEAGIHFFNEKGRVLLDYEAGIGKTGVAYASIMEAMGNKGAKKVLVVTPSATRGDFYKQRETFLTEDMQKHVRQSTANTSKKERHSRHLREDGIHIISQDALRQDASVLEEAGYDMVVIDEIHEMTAGTGSSGRYRALDKLKKVPFKMAMSGTNIKSSKKELYRKIDFVDPDHGLGSMAQFEKRYKGLNQGTGIFQDAANDAFRKETGEWVYTQKNRLPVENKVNTLKVPMSSEQRKAYAASERQYRTERDRKLPGASARRDSRNYAILADGGAGIENNKKVETIIDTMKTAHAGEKAVIHVSQPGKPVIKAMRTAQRRLSKEFGADSVGVIHGETSPGELTKIKAKFNDPGDPLRFIIGTKSLESGHNLQAGGSVTFHLDIPDSAAAFDQRNARVFRKGQTQDTSTYVLSGVNPMDMRSEDLMATKRNEMNIIGNPRSVAALDDTGFIGMLNKYEEEGISA